MKLIELGANKDTFRTVKFNPNGITLIVGTTGEKKGKSKHTYNGVGKSLIIEILHFCLGANQNKVFEEHLQGWEFYLDVTIRGQLHRIRRSTSTQSTVFIDEKELTLDSFKDVIGSSSFLIDIATDKLSFRSLMPRFLRRSLNDYVHPLKLQNDYSDYDTLIRTSFLLGIDLQLIIKKSQLKLELIRIKNLSKQFKEDTVIREFFIQNKDEEIELRFLEDKINSLENDRNNFKVAENYYQIEQEANELRELITQIRNETVLIKNSISVIEKSLQIRPDIPIQKLFKVYEELLPAFKDGVLKNLTDVEAFHHSLIKNRVARLSQEKIRLTSRLKDQENKLKDLHTKLDSLISFMGANKALDELNSLTNQIGGFKEKAQKIRDYQELNKQYKIDMATIKTSMNNEVEAAYKYLDDTKGEFEKNIDSLYRSYVKNFYPNSPSGISVKNNDKDNQLRFDIDVKIENQASDGINHVRIFCYDLLILMAGFNHDIEFIFHDSRLHDGVDPRQRLDMLRLAQSLSKPTNKQYIVTLNQDHLDSMIDYLDENEYENLFESNITLKLSDDSVKSRLLGIQVDIDY